MIEITSGSAFIDRLFLCNLRVQRREGGSGEKEVMRPRKSIQLQVLNRETVERGAGREKNIFQRRIRIRDNGQMGGARSTRW